MKVQSHCKGCEAVRQAKLSDGPRLMMSNDRGS